MFPEWSHILLNTIWLIQSLLTFRKLYTIKIFIPINDERKWNNFPLEIRQFKWMLSSHITFYFSELLISNMIYDFHSMAMHHFLSLCIFIYMYRYPQSLSCVSLIPYILHTFYWTTGAKNDEILYLYNIYFFILGFVCCNIMNPLLPFLSMSIPIVNYYSYCVFYKGYLCYNRHILENFIFCMFVIITCIFRCIKCSKM